MFEWSVNIGKQFPEVQRRCIGALPGFGEHTHSLLAQVATC
jgi:hypothetical protein